MDLQIMAIAESLPNLFPLGYMDSSKWIDPVHESIVAVSVRQ